MKSLNFFDDPAIRSLRDLVSAAIRETGEELIFDLRVSGKEALPPGAIHFVPEGKGAKLFAGESSPLRRGDPPTQDPPAQDSPAQDPPAQKSSAGDSSGELADKVIWVLFDDDPTVDLAEAIETVGRFYQRYAPTQNSLAGLNVRFATLSQRCFDEIMPATWSRAEVKDKMREVEWLRRQVNSAEPFPLAREIPSGAALPTEKTAASVRKGPLRSDAPSAPQDSSFKAAALELYRLHYFR